VGEIALEGDFVPRHFDARAHRFEGAPAAVRFERVVAENIHVGRVASAGKASNLVKIKHLFQLGPLFRLDLRFSGDNLPELAMQSINGFSMCCKIVLPLKSVIPRSPTPSIKIKRTFAFFFANSYSI
jgi:hypothetical protein